MIRIGVLSDSHGYAGADIDEALMACDEIWHAGDIGRIEVLDHLRASGKVVRAVFGNIDNHQIRLETSVSLEWNIHSLGICMIHIGGYPGRYAKGIPAYLKKHQPDIFICGHSHQVKVLRDHQYKLLFLNPGACGMEGFHQMRTLLRFEIDGDQVRNMELVELGVRGSKK